MFLVTVVCATNNQHGEAKWDIVRDELRILLAFVSSSHLTVRFCKFALKFSAFAFFLFFIFFITITNRDITKQTDQYLSQKNQEFNDLNKAVMETLYFCFLRYFSERCRETIMLAIFFDYAV